MPRLTKEQQIASLDEKIQKKKAEIAELEKKKYDLEHPATYEAVVEAARKAGIKPEAMAEKLGVGL